MDAVVEQDLDLLEEYLDGALTPDEVERLQFRLAAEPGLAAALAEAREQRETRAAVWNALEPSDAEVQRLVSRVAAAGRRRATWNRVQRYTRFATTAAACLLIGFFAGWLGRDRGPGSANFAVAPVNEFVNGPVVATDYPPTVGVVISEIRYVDPPNRPVPMLLVREVLPGSPAAESGLRRGDLLLSLDGEPVRDMRSLTDALSLRPGTRVVRVLRDRTLLDIHIELHRP